MSFLSKCIQSSMFGTAMKVTGTIVLVSGAFCLLVWLVRQPRVLITHFQLNDMLIDKIIHYQPFLEIAAGNGLNAARLREKGADIISYDIEGTKLADTEIATDTTRVMYGKNGEFEHEYPDRTLLILCGHCINDSIRKYTGQTIVVGGYYLPESKTQYGSTVYRVGRNQWEPIKQVKNNTWLMPESDWMEEQGWDCIDTVTTNNCTEEHYQRDFIIKVYRRRV